MPIDLKELAVMRATGGGSGGDGGGSGGGGWDGELNMINANIGNYSYMDVPVKDLYIESCSEVGVEAFCLNKTLRTASINTARTVVAETEYKERCFMGCSNLESFKLGPSDFSKEMFKDCGKLKIVEQEIGSRENAILSESMFENCTSLENFDLKFGGVARYCFYNCIALKSVRTDYLKYIATYSFAACLSLAVLDLPIAETIETYAFVGSTALHTLILRKSDAICNINVTAVLGTKIVTAEGMPTGEGFIYVPTSLYEDYVANLTLQATALTGDAATAEYIARAVLRKIEDYPEICG